MEFLSNYAIFLVKTLTIVLAVLFVISVLMFIRRKTSLLQGQLRVRKLNHIFLNLQQQLEHAVMDKSQFKKTIKDRAKLLKADKSNTAHKPRVYILDFDGDIKASATDSLRVEITALLSMATQNDEVVLRLQSGGGMVNSYGFAASQLVRIRQAGVPLTICIDKVAASGGYMMACIGNKIISSPFAILGSIGVVAQIPNLHRLLKKYDVDYEIHTAGEYKRTLTVFGENTDKGRAKFQQDLEIIHQLFKNFVFSYRSQLNIDEVSTGEVWLGINAVDKKLVDELMTSDEYLLARSKNADLFHLHYLQRKTLQDRVSFAVSSMLDRTVIKWITRLNQQQF